MKERCGVMLAEDQHYLMESRLGPVAKTLSFKTVDEYVLEACRPGAPRTVVSPLIDAMTTHETYFFRDTGFWRTLQDNIIPKLGVAAPRITRPLRIWCAAASTGQEPYTLTMLIEENFPGLLDRTSITATDVSEGVLAQASKGVFSVFEVNRGISAPRLIKHFERAGGSFKVKDRLRRPIAWTVQNLIAGVPPGDGFDIVLVRNVLIYFPDATKQEVVRKLRTSIRPEGFLAVGATELLPHTAIAPGWYPARQ
jgi:chemotaxis protein methyltransferase CheR